MKTVLVTGGAGYIGSHTCKALAERGWTPVVYDNLSTGHRSFVKWGPFVQGDLHDAERLKDTFRTFRPVAVFHFAASALVTESVRDPLFYYQNNVAATLTLLRIMLQEEVRSLVFSSTCAVYGDPQTPLLVETSPKLPLSPYGRSKWMVEQVLQDAFDAYGLASLSLRYFNAAGADFSGEIGEDHTPETHLIPSILLTALGLRPEIVLYGTDFPTPDGSAVRDYVHVTDLAQGHVDALEWTLKNKKCEAINLGSGQGFSTLQILEAARQITEEKIPMRLAEKRKGEPAFLLAEVEKARSLIGWNPKSSNPTSIISSAWNWHKKSLALQEIGR